MRFITKIYRTLTVIKKLFLFFLIDVWLIFIPKKRPSSGIALIRLDAIGDFILWLDTAKEFRRLYPNQKITLIVNSQLIDFAATLPYWDDVWSVNVNQLTRNIKYRWMVLCKIKRAGFSIAIQPTYSRTFIYGDALIRATSAAKRIGSEGDLSNISSFEGFISDRWYTNLVKASQEPMMELERNAEFIRNLSNSPYYAKKPAIQILATSPMKKFEVKNYYVVFPGASWDKRRWPSKKFSELIKKISEYSNWTPVLCGSNREIDLCADINGEANFNCINLAGKTNINELISVIGGAKFLVANETSATHIAVALNTPAICIAGGGHYGRFLPYPKTYGVHKLYMVEQFMSCFGCNWVCTHEFMKRDAVPCIENIPLKLVADLSFKIINDITHIEKK